MTTDVHAAGTAVKAVPERNEAELAAGVFEIASWSADFLAELETKGETVRSNSSGR